jgi:ribosomal protein S12 methylthiotransferase accessory factor
VTADNVTIGWYSPSLKRLVETINYGQTYRVLPASNRPSGESPVRVLETDVAGISYSLLPAERQWSMLAVDHEVVPAFRFRGRFFVGPVLGTDGACPACFCLRLRGASAHPVIASEMLEHGVVSAGPGAVAVDTLFPERIREELHLILRRHRGSMHAGYTFSVDLAGHDPLRHRVLPFPGAPDHQDSDAAIAWHRTAVQERRSDDLDESQLVDKYVGPILKVVVTPRSEGDPSALTGFSAVVGNVGKLLRWRPEVAGGGVDFHSARARQAAVGEAVERYSGNCPPLDRIVRHSEAGLVAGSIEHVGLERFRSWFAPQFLERLPGYSRNDVIDWLPAYESTARREVMVPAEVAVLNYPKFLGRPNLLPVTVAGIAAGSARHSPVVAGLLELVERDATMCWWVGGLAGSLLVDLPPALHAVLAPTRAAVEQWHLVLRSAVPGVVTICTVLLDTEANILTVGFACRSDPEHALLKSAAEAWQLRRLSLDLIDPDSPLWTDIRADRLIFPLLPYRQDRQYAREVAEDFSDVTQLTHQLQLALDPTLQERVLSERLRPSGQVAWQGLLIDPGSRELSRDELLRLCRASAVCVLQVDLTTPDVAALGYEVTRVMSPDLAPNGPSALLPVSHPRVTRLLNGDSPYLVPMPHA